MTSLDRPVVPEVGMSTATSAGLTAGSGGGAPGGARCCQPLVSAPAASTPGGARPVVPPSVTSGRSPAAGVIARGAGCWASPASSAGALLGLADTVTAPAQASASQHNR